VLFRHGRRDTSKPHVLHRCPIRPCESLDSGCCLRPAEKLKHFGTVHWPRQIPLMHRFSCHLSFIEPNTSRSCAMFRLTRCLRLPWAVMLFRRKFGSSSLHHISKMKSCAADEGHSHIASWTNWLPALVKFQVPQADRKESSTSALHSKLPEAEAELARAAHSLAVFSAQIATLRFNSSFRQLHILLAGYQSAPSAFVVYSSVCRQIHVRFRLISHLAVVPRAVLPSSAHSDLGCFHKPSLKNLNLRA